MERSHDRNSMRGVPDGPEIVRDEEVGEMPFPLKPFEQIQDLRLYRYVKC